MADPKTQKEAEGRKEQAKGTGPATNPPFHGNILKIYSQNSMGGIGGAINPNSKGSDTGWGPIDLQRGMIIHKDGSRGVRFLYNPSQINLTHPLNNAQVPQGIPNAPTDTQTTNIATDAGSLGFSLLFDRTFEVWQDPNSDGVLVDVRAFYFLTKILPDADAEVKPETIQAMSPEPAYFYFGQAGTGPNASISKVLKTRPLSYYGWITSLAVQYTHWSNRMIPMRATVAVNVNLIPAASDSDPGSPVAGATVPEGETRGGNPFENEGNPPGTPPPGA